MREDITRNFPKWDPTDEPRRTVTHDTRYRDIIDVRTTVCKSDIIKIFKAGYERPISINVNVFDVAKITYLDNGNLVTQTGIITNITHARSYESSNNKDDIVYFYLKTISNPGMNAFKDDVAILSNNIRDIEILDHFEGNKNYVYTNINVNDGPCNVLIRNKATGACIVSALSSIINTNLSYFTVPASMPDGIYDILAENSSIKDCAAFNIGIGFLYVVNAYSIFVVAAYIPDRATTRCNLINKNFGNIVGMYNSAISNCNYNLLITNRANEDDILKDPAISNSWMLKLTNPSSNMNDVYIPICFNDGTYSVFNIPNSVGYSVCHYIESDPDDRNKDVTILNAINAIRGKIEVLRFEQIDDLLNFTKIEFKNLVPANCRGHFSSKKCRFEVECKKYIGDSIRSVPVPILLTESDGDVVNALIYDMQPNTRYEFTVLLYNDGIDTQRKSYNLIIDDDMMHEAYSKSIIIYTDAMTALWHNSESTIRDYIRRAIYSIEDIKSSNHIDYARLGNIVIDDTSYAVMSGKCHSTKWMHMINLNSYDFFVTKPGDAISEEEDVCVSNTDNFHFFDKSNGTHEIDTSTSVYGYNKKYNTIYLAAGRYSIQCYVSVTNNAIPELFGLDFIVNEDGTTSLESRNILVRLSNATPHVGTVHLISVALPCSASTKQPFDKSYFEGADVTVSVTGTDKNGNPVVISDVITYAVDQIEENPGLGTTDIPYELLSTLKDISITAVCRTNGDTYGPSTTHITGSELEDIKNEFDLKQYTDATVTAEIRLYRNKNYSLFVQNIPDSYQVYLEYSGNIVMLDKEYPTEIRFVDGDVFKFRLTNGIKDIVHNITKTTAMTVKFDEISGKKLTMPAPDESSPLDRVTLDAVALFDLSTGGNSI